MSVLANNQNQGQSNRRDRFEIALYVLRILRELGPLRKTRLMQLANLNTRSFRDHVDAFLVALGFVKERGGFYATTPSGSSFYAILRMLEDMGVFSKKRQRLHQLSPSSIEIAETLGGVLEEESRYFRAYRMPCGVMLYFVSSIRSPWTRISLAHALAPVLVGAKALVVSNDVSDDIKVVIGDTTVAYIVHPGKAKEILKLHNCTIEDETARI